MKRLLGFTLIELVLIIVILSILTAVALPRFIDLSSDAHSASVQGVAGELATTLSIAHNNWLAMGEPITTFSPVALNGITLDNASTDETGFNDVGWPNAGSSGALTNKWLVLGSGSLTYQKVSCMTIMQNLLSSSNITVGTGGGCPGKNYCANVRYNLGSGSDLGCEYTYQTDTTVTRTIIYNSATGSVTVTP